MPATDTQHDNIPQGASPTRAEYMLRGLLAIIHRDDGTRTAERGIEASTEEARAIVARLNGQDDARGQDDEVTF
jgi:hypothetical protein